MSLPRYPEYQDSGEDWLGEVPAHWSVMALKYLTDMKGRIGFRGYTTEDIVDEGEGAITLSPSNLVGGELDFSKLTYIHWEKYHESPEIQVSVGDSIIVKTGSTYGKVAFVCSLPQPATINPQLAIFKSEILDKRFLYFLASSVYFNALAKNSNTGSAMPTITQESVLSFVMAVPPVIEQTLIAHFLDHETAKIDALIAEQQRLIDLLKEKRQAVISHVVTKGLDPDVPMKDSRVEWLGEVPAHWEVGALSYYLKAVGDVDHYMPPSVEKGVPYVMTGDLEELASEIDFTGCKQVAHHDYLRLCKKIKTTKGDLIMARYATIGTVAYVDLDYEFLVSYSCVTIKPNTQKALGWYLFFYLKSDSFVQGVQERINTNTQENVGIADLRKVS